jgi:hypothetical protein
MFNLLYLFAAGLGYFIYKQVEPKDPPQLIAEEQKVAIKPMPRVVYRPLNKLLVQDRPNVSITGKSRDQGWLGTPRYDLVDNATGTLTPIYSTEPATTMRVLQI